jgi:hypothetical protein
MIRETLTRTKGKVMSLYVSHLLSIKYFHEYVRCMNKDRLKTTGECEMF